MFDALKKEFFRPIVSLIIPGAVLALPYFCIFIAEHPHAASVIHQHSTEFLAVAGLVCGGLGLVLEDVGGLVESYVIESNIFSTSEQREAHNKAFHDFLQLSFAEEPLGIEYLNSLTVRMKFELGVAVALPLTFPGIIWLFCKFPFCSQLELVIIILICILLMSYLLWEAKSSFRLRSKYRIILVNGVKLAKTPLLNGVTKQNQISPATARIVMPQQIGPDNPAIVNRALRKNKKG